MLPILPVRKQAQKGGGLARHLQGPPPPASRASLQPCLWGQAPFQLWETRPSQPWAQWLECLGHLLCARCGAGSWLQSALSAAQILKFHFRQALSGGRAQCSLHQQSSQQSLVLFTLHTSHLATQAPATLASQGTALVTHSQALPRPADRICILKDPQHIKV